MLIPASLAQRLTDSHLSASSLPALRGTSKDLQLTGAHRAEQGPSCSAMHSKCSTET